MQIDLSREQAKVRAWAVTKEWRGEKATPRAFGEDVALIHSEVSEALEAYRQWGTERMCGPNGQENPVWASGNQDNYGYPVNDQGPMKPQGIGSEFADVFIRLLDCCEHYGIELFDEYEAKMAYNHTRAVRHGGKLL